MNYNSLIDQPKSMSLALNESKDEEDETQRYPVKMYLKPEDERFINYDWDKCFYSEYS